MATSAATSIERSGPAIRAALREVAPDECVTFEAEFRSALAEAGDDFDTRRVDDVLNRWWGIAYLRCNPPTDDERAAVAHARDGSFSGLYEQNESGWVAI